MRALARDSEFDDFVVQHRTDLLRTATLLAAGDRHQAEDLVQQTLTRLYVAWPRVRAAQSRTAYARRVLVNVVTDEARRPWRRREQSWADPPDAFAPDPAPDTAGGTLEQLRPALLAMPPRMRAAVVLRYLHDMTVAQTADALNCSQGNVKSQTSRGLQHLRDALGIQIDEAPPDLGLQVSERPPTTPVPRSAA